MVRKNFISIIEVFIKISYNEQGLALLGDLKNVRPEPLLIKDMTRPEIS
jgi:hypothetical protein